MFEFQGATRKEDDAKEPEAEDTIVLCSGGLEDGVGGGGDEDGGNDLCAGGGTEIGGQRGRGEDASRVAVPLGEIGEVIAAGEQPEMQR